MSSFPPAPLWRRFAALVYDWLLLCGVSLGYGFIAIALRRLVFGPQPEDVMPGPLFQLGWLILIFGFYLYFWHWGGQTLGMRAWRLRLESDNGEALSLRQTGMRAILAPLSLAAFGMGYWWALADRKGATLHDRMSQTRVSVLPKENKSAPPAGFGKLS